MDFLDTILYFIALPFEVLSGKKEGYRIIDYIVFFIISIVVLLLITKDFRLLAIFFWLLISIVVATTFGTLTNQIFKSKDVEEVDK